ncbi:MAG: DNA-protecting protein DprA [Bacteroidetes bacterium]|nr:DNA-protecting protein DprA [Bacteroidota bacterium]
MPDELTCRLALADIPHIGIVQARSLIMHFGTASSIFKAKKTQLEKIDGIGEIRAASITSFKNFSKAEQELQFIKKYKILPLFITDKNYPQRLLNCYDPPTLLFYKGNADLNASKIISIVGTRNNSDYGKQVTEKLIKELANENVLIISGLAFGIDAIAHKSALKNNLSTIGVVAHGLDNIYPPEHSGLAKNLLKQGGLLTEFRSGTKPDKHNFPGRNRIVAGMSDAVIVVETNIKGGSMITAELADGYNKDVFAIPGKVTDSKSSGCNYLIKSNKAILLTDAQQLIEAMGWQRKEKLKIKKEKELFIELSTEEKVIVGLLNEKDLLHIDELNFKSGLSSSSVAAAILSLELQNIVSSMPGKMYALKP